MASLSDDEIQLLGKCKYDNYGLYIMTHPSGILNAASSASVSSVPSLLVMMIVAGTVPLRLRIRFEYVI